MECLEVSIKQYKEKLSQVECALLNLRNEDQRDDLRNLRDNLIELIELTKETLNETKAKVKQESSNDHLADEYAQFQAELEHLSSEKEPVKNELHLKTKLESTNFSKIDVKLEETIDLTDETDIQDDLNALIGSKCQAPYKNKLGCVDYYNALVIGVETNEETEDIDDINVKVMFINPVEKDMIPCPFYLDDKCNYRDNCKFSHGYVVQFMALRAYKEPNFNLIKSGCRVLAKIKGDIWQSTVIEEIVSDDICTVKFEGKSVQVPTHNIYPLSSENTELSDDSDDESLTSNNTIDNLQRHTEIMVERSLTNQPLSVKMGAWEEHTKGIGSKLMAKMGYVVGTGLGKSGDGILEPVQATLLPAGKSLDHCMQLREAAGGSKNLFYVERLQKKLAAKELKKSIKMYEKKQRDENQGAFNIINTQLNGDTKRDDNRKISNKRLAVSTSRDLNVERLKIEERTHQIHQEIYILRGKLHRHKPGSIEHNNITSKVNQIKNELEKLQQDDCSLAREINLRNTKRKMTIF